MIYDYSCRYSSVVRGRQKVVERRRARWNWRPWAWKISGVLVFSAMLFGIAACVWFRIAIRDGLDDLARQERTRRDLLAMNTDLKAKQENLLAEERIGRLAEEMGLVPLAPEQIRRY